MQNSTQTSNTESAQTTSNITGKKLWDEILKAVFLTKPQQLFTYQESALMNATTVIRTL